MQSTDSLRNFVDAICGDGTGFVAITNSTTKSVAGGGSQFFPASHSSPVIDAIKSVANKQQGAVIGFSRMASPPLNGRGKSEDVIAFSVIGMDIDIKDSNKANKALPETIDEAIDALETLPLPPTLIVKSGSGLHAYWRISEDIHINDDSERKSAQSFVANFYKGVARDLPQYSFDATQDIARVFRAPATYNLKDPNNPRLVSIISDRSGERVYKQEEILAVSATRSSTKGRESIIKINDTQSDGNIDVELLQGCNWFREAMRSGNRASYSEWFAVGALFSRATNGRQLFHNWSSAHPDYDEAETDAKFDQVDPEKAERTCEGLAKIDGGKRCAGCVFKGGIHSPIELGTKGKRTVILSGKQLHEKTASLWAGVHVNNNPPRLFSFENQVARINVSDGSIEVLDSRRATFEFARQVDWLSSLNNGWGRPVNPCERVVNDAMVSPQLPLPIIKGVVTIPVFTSQGHLLDKPGYDAESCLFYAAGKSSALSINRNATREDALEALKWIEEEVLFDFPFEEDASKAAAISLALLPFVRELITGQTPLYLLDKPAAGTGATMLTKALLIPYLGREISVKPWTSTEDERRKQITAHLMSGGGPFFFDNLPRYINSDVLAMALTADNWSDRVLQTSQMVKLRNRSIWAATGNNPQFHSQIARRIVRIRLVPLAADPTERTNFRHPKLLNWVSQNRQQFVEKILTILLAWSNAGKPTYSGSSLASYESWSEVMGGILEFLEVPGFLGNLRSFKESQDNDEQPTQELIESWWTQHQGAPLRPAQVYSTFQDLEAAGYWDAPSDKGKSTKAGRWLNTQKDRVFVVNGTSVRVVKNGRQMYLKEVENQES